MIVPSGGLLDLRRINPRLGIIRITDAVKPLSSFEWPMRVSCFRNYGVGGGLRISNPRSGRAGSLQQPRDAPAEVKELDSLSPREERAGREMDLLPDKLLVQLRVRPASSQ